MYYQPGVGTESDFRGHASSFELAIELFGTAVGECICYLPSKGIAADKVILFPLTASSLIRPSRSMICFIQPWRSNA